MFSWTITACARSYSKFEGTSLSRIKFLGPLKTAGGGAAISSARRFPPQPVQVGGKETQDSVGCGNATNVESIFTQGADGTSNFGFVGLVLRAG